MEHKTIKYGNHIINDNTNGYVYNYNSSDSYNFNSHIHRCYEFIHIINGNLLYSVEGSDYMLSDGDIIMTNPDELHSFSFPEKCFYQREFLHIYPNFLNRFPLRQPQFHLYNIYPIIQVVRILHMVHTP